jgi:uncharacterized protein (DUF58 family)
MPRSYRISKGLAAYYVGFSLVWFGGIVGFVIIGQLAPDWTPARIGAALVALLIALAPALQLAWSISYEVTLSDDGECEFHSLLRRRRVRVPQIKSISSDEDDVYIRHDHGKVHLVGVADFKDLLVRLVELNPAIDVEGWLRHALEEVPSATRASRDR